MRKNIIYIFILLILGFGVWFFLFKDTSLFATNEAGFNVKDTGSIYRMFLADQRGRTVTLKRTDKGWTLNDRYPARIGMVNQLLSTLQEQEAVYPVPESMHNTVVKSLSTEAIKIELYDKENKNIRTFYVGGQANNNTGTYMLMDGAKRPYVVQLPSYEGYVTPRYSIMADDWRDRPVVRLQPEEVTKVEMKYEGEELNNFTLIRKDDGTLDVIVHPELSAGKQLNMKRAESYAGFFENINSEGYINGVTDLDSIIANTEKRCEITVEGKNNFKQHIDIYWMAVNKRSKNLLTTDENIPDDYDPDRFYAVINNYKDTVIIQRQTFDKLFQKGYVFYEQDNK